MQDPHDVSQLVSFDAWKERCQHAESSQQPHCQLPNACPLRSRELPGETIRLHTCMQCPNNYPWILDPTGDGFNF